jgi:PKD repeat protein
MKLELNLTKKTKQLKWRLLLFMILVIPISGYCVPGIVLSVNKPSTCVNANFTFTAACTGFPASTSITVNYSEAGISIATASTGTTNASGAITFTKSIAYATVGGHSCTAISVAPVATSNFISVSTNALNPLSVSILVAPSGITFCANEMLVPSAIGFKVGVTGAWTGGPTGTSANPPSFKTLNHLGSGPISQAISFTGEDLAGCTNTATFNYTLNPAPNVVVNANPDILCARTATTFNPSNINFKSTVTVTMNSGSTLNWGIPSVFTSTLVNSTLITEAKDVYFNTFVTAGSLNTITITGTSPNGCFDFPLSKTAPISARETPDANFTFPALPSNVVPFTNTTTSSGGPIEFSWDFDDGTTLAFGPTASPTHTYTVTTFPTDFDVTMCAKLLNGGGINSCARCTTKTISIDATPTAGFTTTSANYCLKTDGNGGTLTSISFTNTTTSNISGGLGSFSYEWDWDDATSNYTSSTNDNPTHSYAAAGTYICTLTVRNASNTVTSTATKTLYINPHALMNGTSDYLATAGHCEDRSIEFKMGTFTTVTNSTLPIRYWMDYDGNNTNGTNLDGFDANNYADNTTGFSPLLAPFYYTHTSTGTITIKGMFVIVATGCKTTYTESFTIDPTPTTTIQFSPGASMCENEPSPPTISSSTAGSAYDWEYIPPSLAVWRPSSTLQSFNPNGTMIEVGPADVNLMVQNSAGCWSDPVSDVFDVWAAPAPNFTNTTVCNINDAATAFTNTTTGPQTTYLWDFDDISSTSTSASPTYDFSTAGTFDVKLTVNESTHGCSEEITKTVTVKPNPTVDFSFPSIRCEQQLLTFTDISSLSGHTISSRTWDWDDATSNTTTSNTTQDHLYTPTYVGSATSVSFNCSLTSTASNGCYDMIAKTVTINKKPAQPTLSVPANSQGHTSNICLGETYTLNATPTSGYAYEWFYNGSTMGSYTTNTYSSTGVGPLPDSRPYQVRITDGNGCYNNSATSTINVKRVNTSLAYTAGYTTLCAGSTVTLTGFVPTPAQSYQWKHDPAFGTTFTNVGTNSKTHLVNSSTIGRYQYDGTVTFTGGSCTETSTYIDVINAPVLTLNYTGTNNINTISPQVLSYVSNPFPTYTSFQWYRNDIPYSTLGGFLVTKPGKYYLVATGSCGIEKSAVVEFVYPCNAVGYNSTYVGGQIFNTTTTMTSSGPVILNGDWEITGGATLTLNNLVIVAGNCSKIKVTNGTLNITNTQLVGCGEWNGIIVNGSANTVNISGSIISEAVVGITSTNGGVINASSNEFDNNNIHIGYSNSGLVNSSNILQNTFSTLRLTAPGCATPHPEYPGWSFVNLPMVYLEQINGPLLFSNKFICMNTNNANIIEGIQAKNCTSVTIDNNYDEGFLDRGINLREGNLMTVYNNTFNFRLTPPLDLLTTRGGWFNTGILMKDVKGSTIERNLVTLADEGIAFYQNTLTPVTVTNVIKNRMENCTYGLVSAVTENPALSVFPYQSGTQTIYLQANCNSFNYNDNGWIGTGGYSANQGTLTAEAGNSFNSNLYWNVCVKDNPRIYYYDGPSEDPYAGSNPNLVLDGVTVTNLNKNTNCFQATSVSTVYACSNKRSKADQETGIEVIGDQKPSMHLSSYPNPFSNSLELKVTGIETSRSFTVMIFDMTGKMLIKKTVELGDNETCIVDTQELVPGMYVMQVLSDSGIIYQEKLVKTDL